MKIGIKSLLPILHMDHIMTNKVNNGGKQKYIYITIENTYISNI